MSDQNELNLSNRLMEACGGLEKSLQTFKDINQKAHFIALSAAIEGARMRSKLGTFSIVASQIANQASNNNQLSEKLEGLINKITTESLEAIAVRNYELASDLIDKLDRNLFERNCDVQAWATFDEVKNALKESSEENFERASAILHRLTSIYVVYAESVLLDLTGNIVSAASNKSLIGQDLSSRDWYKAALGGQVFVSDLHLSDFVKKRCVFYCAPVLDDNNTVLGVLCNAFNWDYALEMITSADYSKETRASIINYQGTVIASTHENQILNDNATWMRAGELAAENCCGFSTEKARNGEPLAIGFSHTKGYNAYKGKNWSAIVAETLGDVEMKVVAKVLEDRAHPVPPAKGSLNRIASEISGQKLLATMKEIDDLVLEINSNNREVKLLAVNASIQAGLAGADGEGFSIIANEVAVLAKKSLTFVEEVNQITSSLRQAVEYSSSVRLVDAAKDTMSKVDRNLFERYCDIQAWSIFSKLVQVCDSNLSTDSEANALLEKVHRIYEVYHDIYLVNLDGKVIATAINRGLIGQNYSQRDWFKGASGGNIFVSDIYVSETLKMPLMSFSSPVVNAEGKMVGVLVSRFNCNFLNDIIRATIIDSSSKCFLLNHESKVIASAQNDEIHVKSLSDLGVSEHTAKDEHGYFEAKSKQGGADQSYGFNVSKGYNTYRGQKWVTVTERPNRQSVAVKQMDPEDRFRTQVLEKVKRVG